MLVMNIHGLNVTKLGAFEKQIFEASLVIAAHSGPVLFGGDFNTRSKKRMNYLRTLMSKYGLKEVIFLNDQRMTVMGNSLDHVFLRDLKVDQATVLSEISTSDHKPLYLELTLER
jgi:endonuclease/exonuclease/phosphatase (EEP) superfamily protein YafD